MADAKKCDRCGAYYMENNGGVRLGVEKTAVAYELDICPICKTSFDNWMKNMFIKEKDSDEG